MAILVALDSLGGLSGHDATDCCSAVGDCGGGRRAKAVNDGWRQKRYVDESDGDGEEGGWNRHLKDCDSSGFFFFIEREMRKKIYQLKKKKKKKRSEMIKVTDRFVSKLKS